MSSALQGCDPVAEFRETFRDPAGLPKGESGAARPDSEIRHDGT